MPLEPFDIGSAKAVPWVRERDVDLLLAESLSTSPQFLRWFLSRIESLEHTAPSAVSCKALVSFSRPDALGDATGETDILALVFCDDGLEVLLSIEDKVLASPQLDQGRRHADLDRQPSR
jgi:hypothetical protein